MAKREVKRAVQRPRAGTSDILNPAPAEKVPAKWRPQFNQLLKLKERLLARRGGQMEDASEEAPNFSQHMADAGSDEYDRNLAVSMASSEQEALYEIDAALQRILNGSYGVCEATGQRIDAERLKAIPWTRFCSAAENRLEAAGAVRQARLGDRERESEEPQE